LSLTEAQHIQIAQAAKLVSGDDVRLRIAGESGEGVITAGDILLKTLHKMRRSIFTYETYPAEVRGGHCWYQVRTQVDEVLSAGDAIDVLLAFNQEGVEEHFHAMREGGFLIRDGATTPPLDEAPGPKQYFDIPIPMSELAVELGSPKSKNVAALGALAAAIGMPAVNIESAISEVFARKGEKVVQQNLQVLRAARKAYEDLPHPPVPELKTGDPDKFGGYLMTGNDAVVLGAIAAGCRFFAGYPITPASPILEAIARELPRVRGTFVQAEDEIAALGLALGASYSGVKAMTATSGPGFSLMAEELGLATAAEIPIVVVNAQRAGPSTGMPTKNEQGDLNAMVFSGHGDAPRIVLGATTPNTAFTTTVEAFNLAERFQMPVIVAMDLSLSQRWGVVSPSAVEGFTTTNRKVWHPEAGAPYKRYTLSDDGVSPIALPGTKGGQYVAEGIEHDESGAPCYTPEMHTRMMEKRYRKLEQVALEGDNYVEWWGPDAPGNLVVAWGSAGGPALEAVQKLSHKGADIAIAIPRLLFPVPRGKFLRAVEAAGEVFVVELNYTGQFAGLLRREVPRPIHSVSKADGQVFTSHEVIQRLEKVIR
jgi:2-oxoglutarate/2-oxoacid ferredoxin oxidoreductase subunit alpha